MNTPKEFKALLATEAKQPILEAQSITTDDLDAGDTLIKVHYSSLNYKDALGLLAKSPIYRKFPIIGGIDLSGEVIEAESSNLSPGDNILVTGCGLGESHCGGYAEYAQVPNEWVIPIPSGLDLKSSMQLGTAGFTAALAIHRLEQNNQLPSMGPILVTGASGGVGLISVYLLNKLGFEVIALSSKNEIHSTIKELGASEVLHPDELPSPKGALSKAKWAGAIDCVGGDTLSKILPQIDLWGNICSIGVAGGANFNSTVMPHILRGVSLLGISSANCPLPLRKNLWNRLATDLKIDDLDKIAPREITLSEVPKFSKDLLNKKTYGRTLIKIK